MLGPGFYGLQDARTGDDSMWNVHGNSGSTVQGLLLYSAVKVDNGRLQELITHIFFVAFFNFFTLDPHTTKKIRRTGTVTTRSRRIAAHAMPVRGPNNGQNQDIYRSIEVSD